MTEPRTVYLLMFILLLYLLKERPVPEKWLMLLWKAGLW